MAQHKSSIKRIRSTAKKTEKNLSKTSKLKTVIKKVRTSKTKEEASKNLQIAISYLDKLGKKGVIHKNKAANQKSKLSRLLNKQK
ncbi:MAG: 30S ribosomal protein S20 [Bacteroidetes bacterium]|nr:30S ribosomal protein S20 [Bacteroidota bacterium]